MRKSVHMRTNEFDFKFRVSGFVIQDNKVLLVEMDNSGFLCLPGGYVELGETTEEACLREFREEINRSFKIDKYCGVVENYFRNKYGRNMHEVAFYYKLSPVDEFDGNDFNLVENDKGHIVHLSFKWVDIKDIDNYNIKPDILKNILKDNLEFGRLVVNEFKNNK